MAKRKTTGVSSKKARAAKPAARKRKASPKKRKHHVKRSNVSKFLLVLGTLSVFLLFMLNKYGFEQGIEITVLIWTFFVLCTPLAVADLLLDVPIRLFMHTRMVHSHTIVWFVALSINLATLHFSPELYEATPILSALHHILTNPIPYWGLIGLCLLGTFLSLEAADEIVDEVEDKMHVKRHKHHSILHFIVLGALIASILIIYDVLLGEMGFEIDHLF